MWHSEKGFTLIELMTVLILLQVIVAIGVPKYLRIQVKSEWDADRITIRNIAKVAEVYAAQKNYEDNLITMADLIRMSIIDGELELNRKRGTSNKSEKNNGDLKLKDYTTGNGAIAFVISTTSGEITNLDTVITSMIGNDPYF